MSIGVHCVYIEALKPVNPTRTTPQAMTAKAPEIVPLQRKDGKGLKRSLRSFGLTERGFRVYNYGLGLRV